VIKSRIDEDHQETGIGEIYILVGDQCKQEHNDGLETMKGNPLHRKTTIHHVVKYLRKNAKKNREGRIHSIVPTWMRR
jgi:hypothetical protein